MQSTREVLQEQMVLLAQKSKSVTDTGELLELTRNIVSLANTFIRLLEAVSIHRANFK